MDVPRPHTPGIVPDERGGVQERETGTTGEIAGEVPRTRQRGAAVRMGRFGVHTYAGAPSPLRAPAAAPTPTTAPPTHPTANATKPTDNAEKMEIAARKISDSREGEKPRKNEHRGYYTHRREGNM